MPIHFITIQRRDVHAHARRAGADNTTQSTQILTDVPSTIAVGSVREDKCTHSQSDSC